MLVILLFTVPSNWLNGNEMLHFVVGATYSSSVFPLTEEVWTPCSLPTAVLSVFSTVTPFLWFIKPTTTCKRKYIFFKVFIRNRCYSDRYYICIVLLIIITKNDDSPWNSYLIGGFLVFLAIFTLRGAEATCVMSFNLYENHKTKFTLTEKSSKLQI